MRRCLFACITFINHWLSAQIPPYYGGGNSTNITVTASSSHYDPAWPASAIPQNTVNDQGMLAPYFDAARFLHQATIGFDSNHVQRVLDLGFEGWITDQFNKPLDENDKLLPETRNVFQILADTLTAMGYADQIPRRPTWKHFNYAWWQVNMLTDNLLRHRVACALSEILVVSRNSDLSEYGDGLASYYDFLLTHAFGNYRDILFNVAMHPCMGFYLSHLDNPKTDPASGTHPDENFAREVMQLFSIGLYELNPDCSHKMSGGKEIPTYDNEDISEFAKVFTGLGIGDVVPELLDPTDMYDDTAFFGMGIWKGDMTVPMRMYETDNPATSWRDEDQHEDGPKYLLNGFVVPSGQTGMQDIEQAIDNLFNHPNVGPFIGYRLIQRLIKSNPSPAYIQRVATAFNGSGPYGTVRGDMKSVLKAILLDEEARGAAYQLEDVNGRLKEPLFRYTHFAKVAEKYNPNGFYWNINYNFYEATRQDILASPSVFNFFLPDDTPNGDIHNQGLVAPEFKLHDSRTSIGYINNVYRWSQSWGDLMHTWEGDIMEHTEVHWVIDDLLGLAEDTETLINWYDKHLLSGMMSDRTRKIMRSALRSFESTVSWHNHQENRVRMGLYLAMIAPEYSIIR
jgi:uncharacterized protein (DUF1800 family)